MDHSRSRLTHETKNLIAYCRRNKDVARDIVKHLPRLAEHVGADVWNKLDGGGQMALVNLALKHDRVPHEIIHALRNNAPHAHVHELAEQAHQRKQRAEGGAVDDLPTFAQDLSPMDRVAHGIADDGPRVGDLRAPIDPGLPEPQDAPRSVRNNNPGNVIDSNFARSQPGYAGDDGRFARYETPDQGQMATGALLDKYAQQGIDTPHQIISKFAPPNENDTRKYAQHVANTLGVSPHTKLDMSDPGIKAIVSHAIQHYEGGRPADRYYDGWNSGRGAPPRVQTAGGYARGGYAGGGDPDVADVGDDDLTSTQAMVPVVKTRPAPDGTAGLPVEKFGRNNAEEGTTEGVRSVGKLAAARDPAGNVHVESPSNATSSKPAPWSQGENNSTIQDDAPVVDPRAVRRGSPDAWLGGRDTGTPVAEQFPAVKVVGPAISPSGRPTENGLPDYSNVDTEKLTRAPVQPKTDAATGDNPPLEPLTNQLPPRRPEQADLDKLPVSHPLHPELDQQQQQPRRQPAQQQEQPEHPVVRVAREVLAPVQRAGEAVSGAITHGVDNAGRAVQQTFTGGSGGARANQHYAGGYTHGQVQQMIAAEARRNGIDPNIAMRVFGSEGRSGYAGDRDGTGQHTSFGPFQLHYAGHGGGMSSRGEGDNFTRDTGLDARDPRTIPQQVEYAMKKAAKNGWGAWHGAQAIGLGNFAGIGGRPDNSGPSARSFQANADLASQPQQGGGGGGGQGGRGGGSGGDGGGGGGQGGGSGQRTDNYGSPGISNVVNRGLDAAGRAIAGAPDALQSNRSIWIPLLTGLGAMASCDSRYLGSAILQGMGAGAQAYSKEQNDEAGLAHSYANTGQTGVNIANTQSSTAALDLANFQHTLVSTPLGPMYTVINGNGQKEQISPMDLKRRLSAGEQLRPIDAKNDLGGGQQAAPGGGGGGGGGGSGGGGGQQAAPGGGSSVAPFPKPPAAPAQQPSIGVNFDDGARKVAESESIYDPNATVSKADRDKTFSGVRQNGLAATQAMPTTGSQALNTSKMATNAGVGSPGWAVGARTNVIDAVHTLGRITGLGGNGPDNTETLTQLANKFGVTQAFQTALSNGQRSEQALETALAMTPNPSMTPQAMSELQAQILYQQQYRRDYAAFAEQYHASNPNSTMEHLPQEFARLHPPQKYAAEKQALAELVRLQPDMIDTMLHGGQGQKPDVWRTKIERGLIKRGAPAGTSRYFF